MEHCIESFEVKDRWNVIGEIICKILSKNIELETIPLYTDRTLFDDIYKIACYHRIDGLLYALIQENEMGNAFPAFFMEALAENSDKYNLKTSKKLEVVRKLCSHFSNLNIPCLCLKGVALSQCIYQGNLAKRIYSDIDILIDSNQINNVTKKLNELGYFQYDEQAYRKGQKIMIPRSELIRKQMLTHELCTFLNDDVAIDVNILFSWKGPKSYDPPHATFKLLWERRVPLETTGGWTLSPNQMFIHLCVHLYNEAVFFLYKDPNGKRETSYYRFYDVYALLKNVGTYNVDTRTVISDIKELNAEKQVAYTCYHLYILFGIGVWNEILDAVQASTYTDPEHFNQYCALDGRFYKWQISLFERMNNENLKIKAIEHMRNMKGND